MINWFSIKVKYTKELDNGSYKRVSEVYLVQATSFTDAEARIFEELGMIIKGEFIVLEIKRYEVHDLFAFDDSSQWYLLKIVYESHDLDDDKSKRITQKFLVTAESAKDAYDRLKSELSSLLVDFQIPSVSLSNIVEIFPYSNTKENV